MPVHATVALRRDDFAQTERTVLCAGDLSAGLFRYPTGVEAIRMANPRGSVVVLPFMGQMVWRATFDGVELAMRSQFDVPRPGVTILDTYGCLAYHAGLLRNGTPSPEDTHPLHGEMPCMPMDEAGLEVGEDENGPWLAVTGFRDYAQGFGAHYHVRPRVTLRAAATDFAMEIAVENRASTAMDLMYICHANFGFPEGGRVVQPVPFDPEHVVTRTAIPGHVRPTERYRALMRELAADPSGAEVLDDPSRFSPEQVFYIEGLMPDADGLVRFLLQRRDGDGFTVTYDPVALPHTIRWLMADGDHEVAALAMPGTCEPEGFIAESRKGHVRSLAAGEQARFTTRLGYADRAAATDLARHIATSRGE